MPTRCLARLLICAWAILPAAAAAQAPEPTRQAEIEAQQAEKAAQLRPQEPSRGEQFWSKTEDILTNTFNKWHPFFQNAYPGGGFSPGVGYRFHVGAYSTFDVRGSYSILGYKRAEAEFVAPRLLHRRASLTLLGGWRDATQVGFFGIGNETTEGDRVNYRFQQPHASAALTFKPTRRYLTLGGAVEWAQWTMLEGAGDFPSIETVYSPTDLPGVGADVRYLHSQASVGFDWRTSPGYARRGGLLMVTGHDYTDRDAQLGFTQIDYEAIQHIPILREAWVVSLHGHLRSTTGKSGQDVPFFMLPWLGGGQSVRGIYSFRFRDQNSLLLQAEWRIMVNRFMDAAFFYDAGKVAPRVSQFDTKDLTDAYGFGVRFHGPLTTPLRVELAKSREGFALVFAVVPIF